MMDYRQPIEPAVIVFAVAGALSLKRSTFRKRVDAISPAAAD